MLSVPGSHPHSLYHLGVLSTPHAPREPVVWITPSAIGPTGSSSARFAARVSATGRPVTLKQLEIWSRDLEAPYGLDTESEAVASAALAGGLSRYHVFGFSAGATVALATALRHSESLLSVAVLEPAVIGDDDWHPAEEEWRRSMAELNALPREQRNEAFNTLLMRPGVSRPSPTAPLPAWGARTEMLEAMLANTGFVSDELAAIEVPVLVVTGGQSSARFALLAGRMVEVIPNAVAELWPQFSHFSPPYRLDPDRFAALLERFWTRAESASVA